MTGDVSREPLERIHMTAGRNNAAILKHVAFLPQPNPYAVRRRNGSAPSWQLCRPAPSPPFRAAAELRRSTLADSVPEGHAIFGRMTGTTHSRPCRQSCHCRYGRRMSFAMMSWWISDVPSQMRSMRASRQKRWIGKSSMRPMPPKICTALSATRKTISEQ